MITATTVVRRALDARMRRMGDKQLIARGQEVRELNEVASVIWRLADGSMSVQQIADAVVAEYDVPAKEAADDVAEFVTEMLDANLMIVTDSQ